MSLLEKFLGVKQTIADAGAQLQAAREKEANLRGQQAAVSAAAAAKVDVRAAVDTWVDGMAAGFSEQLRSRINKLTSDPRGLRIARNVNQRMGLIGEPQSRDESPSHQLDQVLCGLFGQQVKAALAKVLDSVRWDEGLPMADRAGALARLDIEIKAAVAEENELTAAAREAGVPLNGQRFL